MEACVANQTRPEIIEEVAILLLEEFAFSFNESITLRKVAVVTHTLDAP